MANKTSIGDRMKGYEEVSSTVLMHRTPVIIRIDGKAFHTFTSGMYKPYDEVLGHAMHNTMKYLCENVQGCVFGYTQSDEITLVLADYFSHDTSPWFDYKVQKICSVVASMATYAFNENFIECMLDVACKINQIDCVNGDEREKAYEMLETRITKIHNGAFFDARCFNIPIDDVTNNILWRQMDATRNSISAAAKSVYSDKELNGKNSSEKQDMLFQKGINWNDYPVWFKRGCACKRVPCEKETPSGETVSASKWEIDYNMPIISEDREYVESVIRHDDN